MFNALFNLFKYNPIRNMSEVFTYLERIVSVYETEFEKDHDAHIAAYDALIQILEVHKQKIIEAKNGSQDKKDKAGN